ncbi:hypothetical protein GCM10009827_092080 [Dactylosporangium maewongense]|uniref:Uncharacterized protein n=1 Tax=Dactylosporangium maewongense TaxID=634393 RepID=A0ABN2CD05_9ACTN
MPTPAPIVAQIGLSAPRVAIVFDGGGAWHYWAQLAIHAATHLWGGRGFLLIPHVQGEVAPALLQAARTYDPDYVVLLTTTVGQRERVTPGEVPLLRDGQPAEHEVRARSVKQVADDPVPDADGERGRRAVAEACSPYRRRASGDDDENVPSRSASMTLPSR